MYFYHFVGGKPMKYMSLTHFALNQLKIIAIQWFAILGVQI